MCTQAKPFCAICTADVIGEVRREPLGRNGGMVVVCDRCAGEPIEEIRVYRVTGDDRPSYPPGIDDKERIRLRRAWLRQNRFCLTARSHGKATQGVYCDKCADLNRADKRKRYAARRAA